MILWLCFDNFALPTSSMTSPGRKICQTLGMLYYHWYLHILSVRHYTICGAVCFQFTHFSWDDWDNVYTLSYYQHQIRSMKYYPLFRVRSWNNDVRCMSFYIRMSKNFDQKLKNGNAHGYLIVISSFGVGSRKKVCGAFKIVAIFKMSKY